MTLEAYSLWRVQHRPALMALRRLRSVPLGAHIQVQFESELTMRYQIQEMLRIEKIFEAEAIAQEVAVYAPLVPDGSNWKATMLIGYTDPHQRQQALAKLHGVEDRVYIDVAGHERVYAIADEDLVRENEHTTAAVHFLRFEFSPALNTVLRGASQSGAIVQLGCDHPQYPAHAPIAADVLASLVQDLR